RHGSGRSIRWYVLLSVTAIPSSSRESPAQRLDSLEQPKEIGVRLRMVSMTGHWRTPVNVRGMKDEAIDFPFDTVRDKQMIHAVTTAIDGYRAVDTDEDWLSRQPIASPSSPRAGAKREDAPRCRDAQKWTPVVLREPARMADACND